MTVSVRPEIAPLLAKYNTSLSDLPSSPEDTQRIANAWIDKFATALASGSPDAVLGLLVPDAPIWRDLLILSWDFRTRIGPDAVRGFLAEHLADGGLSKVTPMEGMPAIASPLGNGLGWVNAFASLECAKGHGTAVVHLVPTRSEPGAGEVEWKAQGVLMDLDGLNGHPPLAGKHRKQDPVLGGWEEGLAKEAKFEEEDPAVVIIGGSQSGLVIAARLRALGVKALVLERHARIGDSWRGRYGTSAYYGRS
jgi:hypothetical protein